MFRQRFAISFKTPSRKIGFLLHAAKKFLFLKRSLLECFDISSFIFQTLLHKFEGSNISFVAGSFTKYHNNNESFQQAWEPFNSFYMQENLFLLKVNKYQFYPAVTDLENIFSQEGKRCY